MAYVTPKTDWVGGNVPGEGDFNRIEGNNKQNHDDITTNANKLSGIEERATADQTAAEILTAIKTVDGSGSGLDADLLDGNHASAFELTLATDQKRKITISTSDPSGGSDGDIWIKYV